MTLSARLLGAVLALGALVGCGGAARQWNTNEPAPDPYQVLRDGERALLREGVLALESGRLEDARERFTLLLERHPGNLPASVWLQETEVAAYERGFARSGAEVDDDEGLALLRERYRIAADEEPTALAWFLAARLDEDRHAAPLLLEGAGELDPGMSWAHYGLAHVAAREGDWAAARLQLEQVFELDPGHLPALRLHAWLQAKAGYLDEAIVAFEAWLERSEDDLLATRRVDERMRFDLALCHIADGKPKRALELLDGLEGSSVPRSLRLSARAVALQDGGEVLAARAAAQAARRADRDAVLPAVQDALLLELWLADFDGAQEAWRDVVERSSRDDDLASGLQRFRAEVHLQRMQRALDEGKRP